MVKTFKILLILLLLVPQITLGALSYSRTPSGNEINNTFTLNASFDNADMQQAFDVGETHFCLYLTGTFGEYYSIVRWPITGTNNTIVNELVDLTGLYVPGDTLNEVLVIGCDIQDGLMELEPNTNIFLGINTSQVTGINSYIEKGNVAYSSTIKTSINEDVGYVGDNFIKIIIGSGLAVLYELRYWIVALVIIAGIVYFAYRAFLFFRK